MEQVLVHMIMQMEISRILQENGLRNSRVVTRTIKVK